MEDPKTPYFYSAAVREVLPAACPGHHLVRFWLGAPEPHVVEALAAALDGEASRKHGQTACASVYRPHPEALTMALDVVLPLDEANAKSEATRLALQALRECNAQALLLEHAVHYARRDDSPRPVA